MNDLLKYAIVIGVLLVLVGGIILTLYLTGVLVTSSSSSTPSSTADDRAPPVQKESQAPTDVNENVAAEGETTVETQESPEPWAVASIPLWHVGQSLFPPHALATGDEYGRDIKVCEDWVVILSRSHVYLFRQIQDRYQHVAHTTLSSPGRQVWLDFHGKELDSYLVIVQTTNTIETLVFSVDQPQLTVKDVWTVSYQKAHVVDMFPQRLWVYFAEETILVGYDLQENYRWIELYSFVRPITASCRGFWLSRGILYDTQGNPLTPTVEEFAVGESVCVSHDQKWVFVGQPEREVVHVWSMEHGFIADTIEVPGTLGEEKSLFGYCVDFSEAQQILYVTAPGDGVRGEVSHVGRVYRFELQPDDGTLIPLDFFQLEEYTGGEQFGSSFCLYQTHSCALIGSPGAQGHEGKVDVYELTMAALDKRAKSLWQ